RRPSRSAAATSTWSRPRSTQKIARFLASDFLHLMGYRVKQKDAQYLVATKRENRIAGKAYSHEPWVKNR
ncbi:MAG: hypothetical protein RLN96_09865, partial [Pseudomonadales bacterium]